MNSRPEYVIGKDLDCEYFWRMETAYALPLFAMQNIASGETAALSRWAADVTMRDPDILQSGKQCGSQNLPSAPSA